MKKILLFLLLTLPILLHAQYPTTGNKQRLGWQTTGDGLVFRGSGFPAYTPSTLNNAYLFVDTTTSRVYRYTGGMWRDLSDEKYIYSENTSVLATPVKDSLAIYDRLFYAMKLTPAAVADRGVQLPVTALDTSYAGRVVRVSSIDSSSTYNVFVSSSSPNGLFINNALATTYTLAAGETAEFQLYVFNGAYQWRLVSSSVPDTPQTLSFSTPNLSISGGNSVDLSPLISGIPTGTGTTNRGTRWTGANTLGDANFTDDGTNFTFLIPPILPSYTTVGLPTVSAGKTVYNSTAGNMAMGTASAWEYFVKSSTATGLGTSTQVGYFDSNGRLIGSSNYTFTNSTATLAVGVSGVNTIAIGTPSFPISYGTATQAVLIGGGVTSTNLSNGVAVGMVAQIQANGAVAIGRDARSFGVSIGSSSRANSANSTVIGSLASGRGVVIGYQSTNTSTNDNGVMLGNFLSGGAFNNIIMMGGSITVSGDYGMVFGTNVDAGAGELVMGHFNQPITNVYFGNGRVPGSGTNVAGASTTINASGALGTNTAGGSLTAAGGKGRGTGTPGDFIVATATATTSGTTLQSLTNRWWFKGETGWLGNLSSPTQPLHVVGNARVTGAYYDSNNEAGSSGQILSSTVTGTDWINPPTGYTGFTPAADSGSGSNVASGGTLTITGGHGINTSVSGTTVTVTSDLEQPGINWTARTAAQANLWRGLTYGNGLFVATSISGTDRVMTSPDGINWTARTATAANQWRSVTYGNGLFVAVSFDGTGTNRVMTSPDGINWTARTAAAANQWQSVTYGNGLFVAVSDTGTDRVMTSPDGITWTARTAAAANTWVSVTYGNGLFVAVAVTGTGNRIMTSPDGITWTSRTNPEDNFLADVAYGNGLFVVVCGNGTNRVMTSPDGITWTARTAATNNFWFSVTYGNGLFVAVSLTGDVMTSPDGITWTARTGATSDELNNVVYGNGLFVAVGTAGANRVVSSGIQDISEASKDNINNGQQRFSAYGSGNMEPSDLSKTVSVYAPRFATDGTIVEELHNFGATTVTTDGGGLATIAHGLGVSPTAFVGTLDDSNTYLIYNNSKDATNIVFRIRDTAGNAIVSTSVTINWTAFK